VAAAGSWQEMLLARVAMAPRERPRAGYVLARLTGFASTRGVPAVPECLLDYDVIEAFCVHGLAGRAPATRGTYRSVLYQLAVAAQGPQRATPFAGAKAPPPYSAFERAELAAIVAAQRDPGTRASALAVICCGIGAGLGPGELVALRGCHVRRRGQKVVADVHKVPARAVPVSSRYAPLLVTLAREAGNDFVFRPGPADRGYKNFVTSFTTGLAADPAAPRLTVGRCRSSFICDHLAAGTPIAELLAITGIEQAESLARYARHVPGAPAKAVLRAWDNHQQAR